MAPKAGVALWMVGSMLVFSALAGLLLLVIELKGGLTRGPGVRWEAISAITSFAAALISAATLALLALSLPDLERNAQDSRAARGPYVRIDVGFLPGEPSEDGWTPRMPETIFTLRQLRVFEPRLQGKLPPADAFNVWHLTVWLTNLQDEPLGIADDVRVRLRLSAEVSDQQRYIEHLELGVAYLAAGQTTAVEILRVPSTCPRLEVEVREVSYQDVYGQESHDTHGALILEYDGNQVANRRKVLRGKGSPRGNGDLATVVERESRGSAGGRGPLG